jgi:hypothetical protein
MSRRLTSLFLVPFVLSLIMVAGAMGGATPASAHTVTAHHQAAASIVMKKKKHHRHHYSGCKVGSPVQQNDAGLPTTFTEACTGLTPNGFYDVNITDFEDRCFAAAVLPPFAGDGTDIKADSEGRVTFSLVIITCVEGTYSITLVNDALSGEKHETHFHIKAG